MSSIDSPISQSTVSSTASSTASSNWHGLLNLEFQAVNGKTRLTHSQAIAPYKVQRSFAQADGTCQVVMLHTAGGMVGGDRLTTAVTIGEQAQVLLTTAAAAKIYKSTGTLTQQTVHLTVAPQACLEWLPQETILFDRAQYRQDLRIELAAGAQVVLWEITRFGRTARGEQFSQGDWRSHTEVWQAGTPLWIDRQWLPGSPEMLASPHGLNHCPIVGTLAWIGRSLDKSDVEVARQLWDPIAAHHPDDQFGVTRLPQGLLCRYRGHSSTAVRHGFIQTWQWIRSVQGRSWEELPRVWML
ncbi:urease accessory protein UreD [Alkalinema sp. FACHB-956]|uniref:urease accessory protein UreD n=1 Tax=Alkalinema sp. FACHB-956 TaxID=2692768 RepID=UPI00321F7A2A